MNNKFASRRNFLKAATLTTVSFVLGRTHASGADSGGQRPNVLFIAIDDLNHWVGYMGRNPQAKTPNMDRLSKMGVSFSNAHCAAPLCNPSRAALMSGMRPSSTGCYQNSDWWQRFIPEGLGLSFVFKQAGYYTAGAGKIYHSDSFYPSEWDEYREAPKSESAAGEGVGKSEGFHDPVNHDLDDDDLMDWHTTDYCIEQLGKKRDKPFFIACGLHKPHLPWVVARKYYDLFPLERIELPPYKKDDLADIPLAGQRMAKPEGDHAVILAKDRWEAAIQSYLACGNYTDMNIGRLLDALGKNPERDNTIIVLWSDHGWHLGEKDHWRKFTLWEEATRAPFIWVVPGVTPKDAICDRPVDFMCIYPTLCDLTGIQKPSHVEGESIRPLLADPKAKWDLPAITTYGYQNHGIRTQDWRYIRYADGSEELYDHRGDPYEWTNLASKPELESVKADLAKWLPKKNQPQVKGDKASKDDGDYEPARSASAAADAGGRRRR